MAIKHETFTIPELDCTLDQWKLLAEAINRKAMDCEFYAEYWADKSSSMAKDFELAYNSLMEAYEIIKDKVIANEPEELQEADVDTDES